MRIPMTIPAVIDVATTPAEYRALLKAWNAWCDEHKDEMKPPAPAWALQVAFRLGQLAEENHPMRQVHIDALKIEYPRFVAAFNPTKDSA